MQLLVLGVVLLLVGYCVLVFLRRRPEPSAKPPAADPKPSAAAASPRDYKALAAHVRSRQRVPTTILQPDMMLPQGEPTNTRVGSVRVLGRGETWPVNAKGEPLHGLMQVNVAQIAHPPAELEGVAFVSVFWDPTGIARHERQGFVREYASLADLEPTTAPPGAGNRRDFPVRFLEMEDRREDISEVLEDFDAWPEVDQRRLEEELEAGDPPGDLSWYCKVGGMPAPVQDGIDRPLTLQVGYDDVARINLVDTGCLYLWRVRKGDGWEWESDLQFY